MSKESIPLSIDCVEQYDAIENLFRLLKILSLKGATTVLKDLKYDFKADFYCGDCDVPHDRCHGHYDDYPDYSLDDYLEDAKSDDTKPS